MNYIIIEEKFMKKILRFLLLLLVFLPFYSCRKEYVKEIVEKQKITSVSVESITLNHSELNLVCGNTSLLNAKFTPEDRKNVKLNWTSSNSEVARVFYNGWVIAVSEGEATITVRVGNKSSECKVNVEALQEEDEKILEYGIPTSVWGTYAKITDFSLADKKLDDNTTSSYYTDKTDFVVDIDKNSKETYLSVSYDQATSGEADSYTVFAYIDWNRDGDFADDNETIFKKEWISNGKCNVREKISVPSDAYPSSRVRIGIYYNGANSKMEYGCGVMDSGDVRDFKYKLN